MNNPKVVLILLRLGLASVFLYAAIASFITPDNWIGYFPPVLRSLVPADLLLKGFSIYEITLSVWILSGWKTFWSGLLASLTLVGIISSNINQFDVLFRDVAILFMSLGLAASDFKKGVQSN